jgi:hypothetical protein
MTCIRRAWLVLGTQTVALEDETQGYFCTSFDLGSPAVREVVNNRPDRDGVDDRTQYVGSRAVAADITALKGAGATIDAVASMFGPFMVPNVRPTLHYVLDRPGAPERVLTVRGASYDWKVEGDDQRDISLQWVAADPVAYDPTTYTATAWSGAGTTSGRTYNLTFPRVYPASSGPGPTVANFTPQGDFNTRPLVRLYGPCQSPTVVRITNTATGQFFDLSLNLGVTINAGDWIDFDADERTAFWDSDPTRNAIGTLNWVASSWPVLTPRVQWQMRFVSASGSSGVTQAQIFWQNGYFE